MKKVNRTWTIFNEDHIEKVISLVRKDIQEIYGEFFHVLFGKDEYKESLKGNVDFIPVLAENLVEFDCDVDAWDFLREWLHRNIIIDTEL